jgi:DnaJ-class molecular chaperone
MLTHGWNCPDCKGTGKVIEAIQDEECETCKDWDDDDKRVCPDCAI